MPDGILINGSNQVFAVVYGYSATPPQGYSFVPVDPAEYAVGQTFSPLAQQASTLLASGLTISSTGTSALNATYACDETAQAHIQAEMISILANGTFADGATTLAWPDAAGTPRTFPTPAAFKSFAVAVAAFVAGCLKVRSGTSTTLPSATAAIP